MERNISNLERALSVAAGAALIGYALTRPRRNSPALAAFSTATGLIARGVVGYCPVSAVTGRNTHRSETRAALGGRRGIHVREAITINRPALELFRFWRDLSNLPRFVDHLENVEVLSPTRSVWTAKAPAGMKVKWEAEIINEIEGELIAWQSTENADVASAGSVRFTPAPGRGTELLINLQYEPPAGKLGAWVAWLFGEEPSQQIRADLRKLKALLEAGETPRTEGQPSGLYRDRQHGKRLTTPV